METISKRAEMDRKSSQRVTKSKQIAILKKPIKVRTLSDKNTKDYAESAS